jgi:hypothetical protein
MRSFILTAFIAVSLCASYSSAIETSSGNPGGLIKRLLLSLDKDSKSAVDAVGDVSAVNSIPANPYHPESIDNDGVPVSRTATGGFVNTVMVFLTVVAFIGNGAFMIYVFWLSK